eukprot:675031-Rhodomonas_salina.1
MHDRPPRYALYQQAVLSHLNCPPSVVYVQGTWHCCPSRGEHGWQRPEFEGGEGGETALTA